ncbi:MAG TPA: M23 family metallopeptidase [Chthoniobacterales bacterium]
MRNLLHATLLAFFLLTFGAQAQQFARNVGMTRLADGFDYPVGGGTADDYYKSRGFRANAHMGEDWNGRLGGDSDIGAPVNAAAHGLVVLARNANMGWGNVVIVRHTYIENGRVLFVDSLYGHLDRILVREGQQVRRRQLLGTIGTGGGRYTAHLHFELRKNLAIGVLQSSFKRDFDNYFDPTKFIESHRSLQSSSRAYPIALNTFTMVPGNPALTPRYANQER